MLLEIDAGEHDDEPPELWALADIVNVACGGHAGDAASMARVIDAVAGGKTRVGAHPSYPDRDGFGRRAWTGAVEQLAESIAAQCEALAAIARARGVHLASIKPHGRLYWDAMADAARAELVVRAAARHGAVVIGPGRGALREAAARVGVGYLREGFADRAVAADGTLVPRGEPGAVVTDPRMAATRAEELVHRGEVDAICVHGDTEGALAIARAVRAVFPR
jgi:UPF0271 protein